MPHGIARPTILAHVRRALVALLMLSLAVGVPGASAGTHEQVAVTAIGNKTAEATVLRANAFTHNPDRYGGLVTPRPDPRIDVPCAGEAHAFSPSESDIVVSGIGESDFTIRGVDDIDSLVQIDQTPDMARLAWQRWAKPQFIACLRSSLASPGTKIYAVTRMPFPKLGTFSAFYRARYGDPAQPSFATVSDWILLSSACARIRLLVTTESYEHWDVLAFDRGLAETIAGTAAGSCRSGGRR
jgi:hypothetical protein